MGTTGLAGVGVDYSRGRYDWVRLPYNFLLSTLAITESGPPRSILGPGTKCDVHGVSALGQKRIFDLGTTRSA